MPRGGIEPPTLRFSVAISGDSTLLNYLHFVALFDSPARRQQVSRRSLTSTAIGGSLPRRPRHPTILAVAEYSCPAGWPAPCYSCVHNLAKVGVEGSNPFARSKNSAVNQALNLLFSLWGASRLSNQRLWKHDGSS